MARMRVRLAYTKQFAIYNDLFRTHMGVENKLPKNFARKKIVYGENRAISKKKKLKNRVCR